MKIFLIALAVVVAVGALYLPRLAKRVMHLGRLQTSEALARREVLQPPMETPADVPTQAEIFWASKDVPGTVAPVTVELRLSANPVVRARQLISELIDHPPSPAQRTVPSEASLVEFYLLPNGVAVADFSGALQTGTPSGILSEQLAVESIVRTLGANIAGLRELKILIGGQEADTLAGHVDLTGYFALAGPPTGGAPGDATPSASQSPPAK